MALQLSTQDLMEVTLAKIAGALNSNAPAPGPMTFVVRSVNLNAAADTPVYITLPTGYKRFKVTDVTVANASTSLTTATLGVYTAVAAGGQAIVTTTALSSITASTDNTAANMMTMTLAAGTATESSTALTLYAHVGTAQGAAATADVSVTIIPLS